MGPAKQQHRPTAGTWCLIVSQEPKRFKIPALQFSQVGKLLGSRVGTRMDARRSAGPGSFHVAPCGPQRRLRRSMQREIHVHCFVRENDLSLFCMIENSGSQERMHVRMHRLHVALDPPRDLADAQRPRDEIPRTQVDVAHACGRYPVPSGSAVRGVAIAPSARPCRPNFPLPHQNAGRRLRPRTGQRDNRRSSSAL